MCCTKNKLKTANQTANSKQRQHILTNKLSHLHWSNSSPNCLWYFYNMEWFLYTNHNFFTKVDLYMYVIIFILEMVWWLVIPFYSKSLFIMNLVPRNIVTSGSAGKTIQLLSGEVKALTGWFMFWSAPQFNYWLVRVS